MTSNSLQTFTENIVKTWGPLTSEMVAGCCRHLEGLLGAEATEDWLAALHRDEPDTRALYSDPTHGFILLAHAEHAALYRSPHDHGRGWVIYAVQQGEIEMCTYARITDADGRVRLVKRDATPVRAGQVKVFLPGDVHDTRCISSSAMLFRFTDRDLKKELEITRYVERDGVWTLGAA